MRFRFCGDIDCPDWVLAEMNSLSRLTSVKMRMLCQEVMKSLSGNELDYETIKKLTADAKYNDDDREGGIAAIAFVIRGSIRHSLSPNEGRIEGEDALVLELTQLGLPKELASAIAKMATSGASKLQKLLKEDSLRLNHLEAAEWSAEVNEEKGIESITESEYSLKVRINGAPTFIHSNKTISAFNIIVTPVIVPCLLQDLRRALSRMEEI